MRLLLQVENGAQFAVSIPAGLVAGDEFEVEVEETDWSAAETHTETHTERQREATPQVGDGVEEELPPGWTTQFSKSTGERCAPYFQRDRERERERERERQRQRQRQRQSE